MTVSCQAAQRSACAPCAVACALLRRRERRGQWPPGQLNWPARHGPRLLLTDLSGPQITQHRPFVAERKCPSSPNHKGLARRDRCDKRGRPARKGLRNVRHADTGSTSLEADLVALAAVLERRSVELDCGFEACKGPHLASHCVQMQVGRPRQSVHVAFALQARRRVVVLSLLVIVLCEANVLETSTRMRMRRSWQSSLRIRAICSTCENVGDVGRCTCITAPKTLPVMTMCSLKARTRARRLFLVEVSPSSATLGRSSDPPSRVSCPCARRSFHRQCRLWLCISSRPMPRSATSATLSEWPTV